MATWITLTEDDLRTALSGREIEALRYAAKDAGENDPVAGIMSSVSAYVRGWVAKYPKNRLGQDGTIPECLKETALALVVWRIMGRAFGDVVDPQGLRKDAAKAAEDLLKDIARGEGPAILLPTDPIDDTRPVMPFSYSNDDLAVNEMTRDDQVGSSM